MEYQGAKERFDRPRTIAQPLAKPGISSAIRNGPPKAETVECGRGGMTWPVLGAIRFFLALVVAGSHLTWYVRPDAKVLAIRNFSGRAAVLGFLVISGYSIAASYLKQREGFYARRALRIVPLYVMLIAFSAYEPALFGGQITVPGGPVFTTPGWRELLGNLFFLQGILVTAINTNAVVWTLSVELFFYLFTPLIARLSQRALIIAVCGLAGSFAFSRFFNPPFYTGLLFGINVPLLGWAWLLGFWMRRSPGEHTMVVAQSIGVCAIAFNQSFLMFLWPITWTVTILGIGYGRCLPYHKRTAQILSVLGDASYPLYLAHMPVFLLIYGFHLSTTPYVFLFAAVVLSVLLDRALDRPLKFLIIGIATKHRPRVKSSMVL